MLQKITKIQQVILWYKKFVTYKKFLKHFSKIKNKLDGMVAFIDQLKICKI